MKPGMSGPDPKYHCWLLQTTEQGTWLLSDNCICSTKLYELEWSTRKLRFRLGDTRDE